MFSERIKDLRKENGLTQIDLAKRLGVSSGTVAMWETGKRKPSFDMFNRLTEVFGESIDSILGSKSISAQNIILEANKCMPFVEYEDIIRQFSLLDCFGQKTIMGVLRAEFSRCKEQGTLKQDKYVSVSIKINETGNSFDDEK